MDYYECRNGNLVTRGDLGRLESLGKGEVEISGMIGISRQQLLNIRKKLGYFRKSRCDKGCRRVSDEEKRLRWNAYQREYRLRKETKTSRRSIRVGDKVVRLARHNAPVVIGRQLMPSEVVHHIDGDPMNDDYGNLMVFKNQKDHLAFHRGVAVEPVSPEII